jgi:alkylhydroperoxidase family enzyme
MTRSLMVGTTPERLNERDNAIIAYSIKLTRFPETLVQDDVTTLRTHGLNDRAILEINLAVAYMNFVNRIASGLGVELEADLRAYTR